MFPHHLIWGVVCSFPCTTHLMLRLSVALGVMPLNTQVTAKSLFTLQPSDGMTGFWSCLFLQFVQQVISPMELLVLIPSLSAAAANGTERVVSVLMEIRVASTLLQRQAQKRTRRDVKPHWLLVHFQVQDGLTLELLYSFWIHDRLTALSKQCVGPMQAVFVGTCVACINAAGLAQAAGVPLLPQPS